MLSAVERTLENPPLLPTASSSRAFTPTGIAPRIGSASRNAICTGAGAMRTGEALTEARTASKSASSSPGKCFSPIGPGNAPMSFGRCIIARPAPPLPARPLLAPPRGRRRGLGRGRAGVEVPAPRLQVSQACRRGLGCAAAAGAGLGAGAGVPALVRQAPPQVGCRGGLALRLRRRRRCFRSRRRGRLFAKARRWVVGERLVGMQLAARARAARLRSPHWPGRGCSNLPDIPRRTLHGRKSRRIRCTSTARCNRCPVRSQDCVAPSSSHGTPPA